MFPQRLTDGYTSFLHGSLQTEQARYQDPAEHGQHPDIMVIGCGDSRVAPETIFDAGPGEMFVVRNIAAVVPPCEPEPETASTHPRAPIELGVTALDVGLHLSLGTPTCGRGPT